VVHGSAPGRTPEVLAVAVQIIALLVFAAVFVITEVRRSHIGIVMFAAACGVGLLVAGQGLDEILEGFPVDI